MIKKTKLVLTRVSEGEVGEVGRPRSCETLWALVRRQERVTRSGTEPESLGPCSSENHGTWPLELPAAEVLEGLHS